MSQLPFKLSKLATEEVPSGILNRDQGRFRDIPVLKYTKEIYSCMNFKKAQSIREESKSVRSCTH